MENGCKPVMSVKEAAKYLSIGETKMYCLTKQDGFPVLRLGKRILIPTEELKIWITEQSRKSRRTG